MKKMHYTWLIVVMLTLTSVIAPAMAQNSSRNSPLAKYPGFGHNPEADEKQFEDEEVARERKIARCMEREGFTYWPMSSVALDDLASPREAMAALRDNPNDRYVLLLNEDGRLRYNRALYGVDDPNALEADGLRSPVDPRAGGCAAEASRAIPGVFAARSSLSVEFNAMRQAVLADQRVKAAEAQWAICMHKRGYSLTSPGALRRQMDDEFAQNIGSPENLKKLGVDHRKAMDNSAACVQESSLDKVVAAVRVEQERAFVRKNRKFLEDFRKTLEQQSLE